MEILKFSTESFGNFIVSYILLALILGVSTTIIGQLLKYFLTFLVVFKHGYPPSHCNALGELKEEKDNG